MANNNNNAAVTKVVTGKVRLSYVHVFKPTSVGDDGNEKYSVSVIIPKEDKELIRKINAAVDAAIEAGKNSKFGGKIPTNLKKPLRDGDVDREEDEAYQNAYFINATSSTKPGVVDRNLQPILDADEVYSGCYGRVSINFFAFNTNGNKGIAAGLNNIQKLADGEPLGGRTSPESDFGDDFVDDEDDF